MRPLYLLLAALFLLLALGIDTAWGHTILGKAACLAALVNTLGFGFLALPTHPKE